MSKEYWRVADDEQVTVVKHDVWGLKTNEGMEIELTNNSDGHGFWLHVNETGVILSRKELRAFVLAAEAFITGEKGEHK